MTARAASVSHKYQRSYVLELGTTLYMAPYISTNFHTWQEQKTVAQCVQVYDGSRANWKESDVCHPVNAYGRTKLEAEQLIQVGISTVTTCFWGQIVHDCALFF